MYAVIQSGSKQYKVEEGDIIDIEKVSIEKEFICKEVLFVQKDKNELVGAPFVKNYEVRGELLQEIRTPKVIAFRFKRRKNQRVKKGHRQNMSRVKITSIRSTKKEKEDSNGT